MSNISQIKVDDDDLDAFDLLATPSLTVPSMTSSTPKKRGWPKRHMKRQHLYYNFFRVYRMLELITNSRKWDTINKDPNTFSDKEIAVVQSVIDKLEELRKDRFNEYFRIKYEERENKNA